MNVAAVPGATVSQLSVNAVAVYRNQRVAVGEAGGLPAVWSRGRRLLVTRLLVVLPGSGASTPSGSGPSASVVGRCAVRLVNAGFTHVGFRDVRIVRVRFVHVRPASVRLVDVRRLVASGSRPPRPRLGLTRRAAPASGSPSPAASGTGSPSPARGSASPRRVRDWLTLACRASASAAASVPSAPACRQPRRHRGRQR